MGLLSDYLEDCRDSIDFNELDPCMFIKRTLIDENIMEYCNKISQSKSCSEIDADDLLLQSCKLEKLKANYLIAEKMILELKNKNILNSYLVIEIVDTFINQLKYAYISLCEIRKEIDKLLSSTFNGNVSADSEETIRNDILTAIMKSVIECLKNSSVIDTSECRKVVNDSAEIICYFAIEKYNMSRKQIVSYYFEKNAGLLKSNCECKNCGKKLYLNMPYCFNCYERNI